MGLIEPLIAVVLGAFFLDERLTLRTGIGGICILIAVSVVLDLRKPPASAKAPAGKPSAKAPAGKPAHRDTIA